MQWSTAFQAVGHFLCVVLSSLFADNSCTQALA